MKDSPQLYLRGYRLSHFQLVALEVPVELF